MIEAASAGSLERLVPSELDPSDITGRETFELHLARYEYAARFVRGGRVLDCACGVGYGSAVLANAGQADHVVIGVDIDAAAIAHANASYASKHISFENRDAADFDSDPFDTIVSFETIEHVAHPDAVVTNLTRLLKAGGSFIASVPITPSVDVNPYHLHDFSRAEFRRLFQKHGLREVDSMIQVQPYSPLRMLCGQEVRLADMRSNLTGYYLRHPKAALRRLYSTFIDGFCNKYLVCVFEKSD